jgi:protein-tyrosine-phosphatase
MSNGWTHTTPKQLQAADIVIFMDKKHHHHSKRDLGFTGKRYEIWNIPDLDDLGFHGETSNKEEEERNRMRVSEQVYQKIKHKVDAFVSTLKK